MSDFMFYRRRLSLQKARRFARVFAMIGPLYLDIQANLTDADDHLQRGICRVGLYRIGNVAVEF